MQDTQAPGRIASAIVRGMAIPLVVLVLAEGLPGRTQSQQQASASKTATETEQSFEVASIKPSTAQAGVFKMGIGASPGGRFTASGVTVKLLVQQAYGVRDYQISGGPSWMSSERYDIVAKAETPNISKEQMKVLLQSLLVERFNLKIRRETRQLPIYELVVGKTGSKLHPSEVQPAMGTETAQPDSSKARDLGPAPVFKTPGPGGGAAASGAVNAVAISTVGGSKTGSWMAVGPGRLNAQSAPVSLLVTMLSQQLGRPVVDKTGLTGNYEFNLEWTPDETQRGLGIAGVDKPDLAPQGGGSGPSIFTAVQEQLGLKLESKKGPVEILVIERVDKPSGN